MSYSQEISIFHLPDFSLLNLMDSDNPFFSEFPLARNYAGEIRSAEHHPDLLAQIVSDFTRGAAVLISGKGVTTNDVIAEFTALVGKDEVEKVACAYSQTLAEALISPLSNVDYMASKNFFSNLFKNSAGQLYFAACRHKFGIGGIDESTDRPKINIPGEVLFIYAYNPQDGQFHLEYPLVSNPLLKMLYEEDIKIDPTLEKSAADLTSKNPAEVQPVLLMQKIQQSLDLIALYSAAQRGDLALVTDLSKTGLAQVNLNNACEIANNANHPLIVEFLKKKGATLDKQSAFFFAVEKNNIAAMRRILKTNSIKINAATKASGNTALHFAAISGTTSAVDYLLACRAEVNQVNKQGNTPLHLACQNGSLGAVNALLQGGANPNLKNRRGKSSFEIPNLSENPALERFIKVYQDNADSVQKIYALFKDIKALPYQYCGSNKQRIDVINNLIKQVKIAELHLIQSEKPPNEILQNLKDAILKASQDVDNSHQISSFAFFRFFKHNITSSALAKLLGKIEDTHKIKPKLTVTLKDHDQSSAPNSPQP